MNGVQLAAVRREAVHRVLARRRPLTERVQAGRTRDQDLTIVERQGSEYVEPASLGEWIDDQAVARYQFRGPFVLVLADALEEARSTGQDAARVLVSGGRRLTAWDQWRLYTDLRQLADAATLPAARTLTRSLISAWERTRGLAQDRPRVPEFGEPADPAPPARIAYPHPLGIPAGRLPA